MSMLGLRQSEATKRKISLAHKGKKKPWAGKYIHQSLTEEHKENIGKSITGRPVSQETRDKIRKALLGHKHSEETRGKISLNRKGKMRGDKHPNWRGGSKEESSRIRKSAEYNDWRKAVYKRDNYTCQLCGETNVRLHADHIKRFSDYHELRFELSNGRALCVPCHMTTDTWGNSKHAK